MRPDRFIALRYLFAKKSHNAINIISMISVLGVMVGTAGLIIVLSVFNGFSGLVLSLYSAFDPDIKVTPATGKTFDPARVDTAALMRIKGVHAISWTLEENALLKYGDRQYIATIKGVDSGFLKVSKLESHIIDGACEFTREGQPFAVMGSGVAWSLAVTPNDPFTPLVVYVPKKGKPVSVTNPDDAFNVRTAGISGVFSIQQDFDTKYVLVPLEYARDITGSEGRVSSLEIALDPEADAIDVRDQIVQVIGTGLKAETRLEQNALLFRIMTSEKWAVYFILSFILVIAVFNIAGSLTMLIIEKKKDIAILRAMGAPDTMVRNIFRMEGILITTAGAMAGILLGGIICFIQQEFGLIHLENSESFVIEAYPVQMQVPDFLLVLLIVMVIGWAASAYTSSKAVKGATVNLLRETK
jgi:lipoprotein-releasing system permease protein